MHVFDFLKASRWLSALSFSLVAATFSVAAAAEDSDLTGEQIYTAQCARCHGSQGEGTKENQKQLAGDLSVAQLTEVVAETMPEDDVGSLSAGEARLVSAYIHDAFYSAIARARNRPAQIEVSRLTVRQYRRSVADLIGSFREPAKWDERRGVFGEYYSGRRIGSRRSRAGSRLDAQVAFDFGATAPIDGISEPREFSIRWNGTLLAPETGWYEFVARTEHAARLWINDLETPLVDAWVKSGDETDHRGRLFLIAGRVYPLQLDFTKATLGVDNSNKRKVDPPSAPASMTLLWQRPQGIVEPIPARNLSPNSAAEVYVCKTPFPPDDRSFGWERGISVSKAWDEATTSAAIDAAHYVGAHVARLAGVRKSDRDYAEKIRAFCRTFVERAFCRPLSEEQQELFIERQFKAAADPEAAVKRVVMLSLKSPRFLFREVDDQIDSYDVAARLALGLWDSLPDRELWNAAAEGRLETKAQIAQQAERMLADMRAKTKLREFLLTWLKADSEQDLSKNSEAFPGFDAAVAADLRTSLELFLDDVAWSEASDYRRLLLADEIFLNERLAAFYGIEPAGKADFAKLPDDSGKRAGILTHPYVMASFASTSESSPIHRGVFLARGVLGQSLRPPPVAVAPLAPDLHPGMTTRERVSLQTKATTCMSCHSIINPLGFTLEHFDAVGRYRKTERGKPVDVSGSYQTRSGKTVALSGARELAEFLAGSDEAHTAFAEQLFHHLVQQSVRAYGPTRLDDLRQSFAAGDFNIRKLAIEIMVTSAPAERETKVAQSDNSTK